MNYGKDSKISQIGIPKGWIKVRSRTRKKEYSYFNINDRRVYQSLPPEYNVNQIYNTIMTEIIENISPGIPLVQKIKLLIEVIDQILANKLKIESSYTTDNKVTIYLNRALSWNYPDIYNILSVNKFNQKKIKILESMKMIILMNL